MKKSNRRTFIKHSAISSIGLGLIGNKVGKTNEKPALNPPVDCNKTTLDYYGEGPFYTDNPPVIVDNQLANESENGERLIIKGHVFNLDCDEVIPNAKVDVWHADHNGAYDNNGFNLRGYTFTDDQGYYEIETIKPGKYLNGSSYRPSHIHLKITAPGEDTVITQLYFEGDTDIDNDSAASITEGTFDATHRIIPLTIVDGNMEGVFDIVINGTGVPVGTEDIHIDKGIIYKVNPNPFDDKLFLEIGVFKQSHVSIELIDYRGLKVEKIVDEVLTADRYNIQWDCSSNLPSGHYFIVFKMNDLQIHHVPIIKS